MTPPLFDVPAVDASAPLVDAPTARLLLPADASREEWLEVRRGGIGGSDVAAILGMNKYSSPRHVFEEKHGRDTFKGNEASEIGSEIESFIAHMFTKRSGVATAEAPGTLVHVDHPWARVNVDRFTFDEGEGPADGVLECKNRSEYQASEWEDGAVPDAPAIQCHWGMAVGGWSHGYVAALVGGNRLRWVRLERDEEMIGYLLDHCGKWFERHVVAGEEPPADGLEATADLLAKLWSVKAETVLEVDAAKAKELRHKHLDIKAREKALKEELRLVEAEIKLLTGENEIAKVGKTPAWSWKANGTFASKQFAEAHPDLAAKYTHMVPALDMDRLKDEQPDTYAKFRARKLLVPTKGI
ncbi:YqaJ viral recombinase family nuclease [[Kitasatospora] papulosa]